MAKKKKKKKKGVPAKTPAELHQLATGIVQGRIFTDRHLDDVKLLPKVFLPIVLGAFRDVDPNTVGMIYADMGSATGMAVNGYPMFRACAVLNKSDAITVYKLVAAMHTALKNVTLPA